MQGGRSVGVRAHQQLSDIVYGRKCSSFEAWCRVHPGTCFNAHGHTSTGGVPLLRDWQARSQQSNVCFLRQQVAMQEICFYIWLPVLHI